MTASKVNGTWLHRRRRGHGPPLLMIMGATGDGGHFDVVAEALADEFSVITYDRRGNGRSPAPSDWTTTSPGEQADDAIGLLEEIGQAPATVFGTSSGATFALCLAVRRPQLVSRLVLHDPSLYALLDDFGAARAPLLRVVEDARATGGLELAVERFWTHLAGEGSWDLLDGQLRSRIVASCRTLFEVELGTYEQYLPDDAALSAIGDRVEVLVGDRSPWFFREIGTRLAGRLGVPVRTLHGGHAAYHDDPQALADVLRRAAKRPRP